VLSFFLVEEEIMNDEKIINRIIKAKFFIRVILPKIKCTEISITEIDVL
jgi:hypothetical protein